MVDSFDALECGMYVTGTFCRYEFRCEGTTDDFGHLGVVIVRVSVGAHGETVRVPRVLPVYGNVLTGEYVVWKTPDIIDVRLWARDFREPTY